MAPQPNNRRLLIGVGIFALLIGINLFVRIGRGPKSPVASPPPAVQPQPTTPAPNQPGTSPQLQPSPSPALVGPGNPSSPGTSSSTALAALFASPLPQTSPTDAIEALRDRLLQLPPILQGPPSWGRKSIPAPTTDARNPFQWLLPEPVPLVIATEVASVAVPLDLGKPEEKKVIFSGSVIMGGKRFAFIRQGKEMHVIEENDTLPQTSLVLASISTDSAQLLDSSGGSTLVESENSDSQGFIRALAALQHPSGLMPLPIHESKTGSENAAILCYLTNGKTYHAVETCTSASGPFVGISSPGQLPAERTPCPTCWTKDPL